MTDDKTILIVDDNAPYRHLVAAFLRKDDYITIEAEDGQQALDMLAHQHVDAIVIDLQMMPMGGFGFIEKYTEKGYTAPVILVTSDQDENILEQAAHRGFCAILKKPLNEEALLHALVNCLT